jgi:hypothetical protein
MNQPKINMKISQPIKQTNQQTDELNGAESFFRSQQKVIKLLKNPLLWGKHMHALMAAASITSK